MQTLKNSAVLFLGAFIACVLLAVFVAASSPRAEGSTINLGPFLQTATTTGSVAVTSSVRLLATTTNPLNPSASYTRIYATICNANSNPVYISLNGDKGASLTNATAVIAAAAGYDACFEVTDRNPYTGSITASSTNQTSTTVTYSDYVY